MVELALLIGIFSYLVFGVGLLGWLGPAAGGARILGAVGGLGILGLIFWERKKILLWLKEAGKEAKKDPLFLLLAGLFLLQALINLEGALGPELGFDSLWYHLTLPKIYLQQGQVFFLRGGLFYYSAMPKLTEMLYLVSLSFSPAGTLAKIIHFSFGILTAVALYNLGKRYLKPRWAALSAILFYSTLIVGWQSTTAYVDLGRTFFEVLALDLFLQSGKRVEEGAILLGLAISTKLLALASLPVFLILVFLRTKKIKSSIYYLLLSILIASPWLVFAFLHTGNPVYPVFSGILDAGHRLIIPNALGFFRETFLVFFRSADPISPVFLIFLPVLLWRLSREKQEEIRLLSGYVLGALIFWYLTPRTGGSRFLLPYLPGLSLLLVWSLASAKQFWQKTLWLSVILTATVNLGYRALANAKYLPVLLGRESRDEFLSLHLNSSLGDFYDPGSELKKIIGRNDLVLVLGGHNLFYVDFPFIHFSFAQPGIFYSYLLTQNEELPEKYRPLKLVYQNPKTKVNLYLFGQAWYE